MATNTNKNKNTSARPNQRNSGRGKNAKKKQNKRIIILAIEIIAILLMLGILGAIVWSDQVVQPPDFSEEDIQMNPVVRGKEVAVNDLSGVEILVQDVKDKDGNVILKAGTELNEDGIQVLKDNNITNVYVADEITDVAVDTGYWNIALFGVDSTTGSLTKGTRSDSMIILSINQNTYEVKMVSVYRDTYLKIGEDRYAKCNGAYAAGGANAAMGMLNVNMDLDITDFVTVGFEGLSKSIDALGGVYVDVDKEELRHINSYQETMAKNLDLDGFDPVTETGYQKLNGLQATAYCRIRYKTGNDFARAESQREVIQAIVDQARKADLATLTQIANDVMPSVYTSFELDEIIELLAEINKYQIVDEGGFPHEDLRTTGTVGSKGSLVVPVDLEKNVVWLHEFLFGVEDYKPSKEVKEYSRKIYNDTQSYLGYTVD